MYKEFISNCFPPNAAASVIPPGIKDLNRLGCPLAVLFCLWCWPAFGQSLPDLNKTPGIARTDLTQQQICTTKWGKDERAVTQQMKNEVFKSYGFELLNKDPRCPCEIDHLISRELGGADDVNNLWVQSYSGPWNAHNKDRLENRLHVEVCAGRLSLSDAQTGIVKDWTQLYIKYFGELK